MPLLYAPLNCMFGNRKTHMCIRKSQIFPVYMYMDSIETTYLRVFEKKSVKDKFVS